MPMTLWESKTSKDVLIALNDLGKLVCQAEGEEFCYEAYYLRAQLIRYYYTLQIILSEIEKGAVLDIGNYPGHLHSCLLGLGYDVDGIDLNPARIPANLTNCRDRTFAISVSVAPCGSRHVGIVLPPRGAAHR